LVCLFLLDGFLEKTFVFPPKATVFAWFCSVSRLTGAEPRVGLAKVVSKYQFAEFEIDLSQQELRRLGAAVHIEPQVFDLIVHLVRNHDRIVSKDELIETIWNGRIISEAALSSRINGARRALGDNGNDQALIRTLHKRGFRFVGSVQAVTAPDADARRRDLFRTRRGNVPGRVSVSSEVSRLTMSSRIRKGRGRHAIVHRGDTARNMSDDPENDYSAMPTEDIIRLLARNRWLRSSRGSDDCVPGTRGGCTRDW
jgi:DNA-binding winged helix-turn-helix (wHTH) protein